MNIIKYNNWTLSVDYKINRIIVSDGWSTDYPLVYDNLHIVYENYIPQGMYKKMKKKAQFLYELQENLFLLRS